MKRTMRFNTEEEMNNYFPDGVPNNVLGIVDNPTGNNVLYTSSNNQIVTGEEEGGYITAPEDLARIAALEEGKADKTELVGLASETWVENKNYLTEHQSLNGYATEAYVSAAIEAIPATDLTGYATEAYVTSKIEDVVGVAPAALDTLQELAYALNDDADFAGTMTSALAAKANSSDVYTKQEIDNAGYLTSHQSLADYVTKTDLSNASYLTQHQSLSDYPTKAEISAAGYITSHQSLDDYALKSELPSLNGYATETWVGNQGFLTQHQSLSDYPTKAEISAAGYITSHQSLSDYVTKTELSNASYLTQHQSLSGYATESYVATYVATYAPTPDLTNYVTKTDLSGCGYITGGEISQMGYITANDVPAAPDLSAYVSKTELEGMSYATESYVSSNYWKQPYGITIISDNDIRFGHNASEYETTNARITPSAWGLRILSDSISKNIQLGYVGNSNIVEIGNNVKFKYDNVYLNGVGNYDGTNEANAYTLAYVINNITTQIGAIETVVNAILGTSN